MKRVYSILEKTNYGSKDIVGNKIFTNKESAEKELYRLKTMKDYNWYKFELRTHKLLDN